MNITAGMTLIGKIRYWVSKITRHSDPICTPAMAGQILARLQAENAWEDAMYDEWYNGPGKIYPRQPVMMRDIEGAPLRPVELLADGWIDAFRTYCAEQKQLGRDL